MTEPAKEPWHLDRKVPLALILALLLQTAGMVWWAASLSSKVAEHTADIGALQANVSHMNNEAGRIREVLARLDERLAAQNELLRRVDAAITQRGRQ
jgi:uncharacterized coiled-coil protein SlyX